jgi:hypothetical protein
MDKIGDKYEIQPLRAAYQCTVKNNPPNDRTVVGIMTIYNPLDLGV